MPTREENLVLDATAFLVVTRHREETGEDPTGFHLNKYLSILQRETGGTSSPLHLPHCWFRWGDEVAMQEMPSALHWTHLEPPAAYVSWDDDEPPIPDDALMSSIAKRIDGLVDEYAAPVAQYSKSTKLRNLIAHVYSYAPFSFQDHYRQLREVFVDIRGSSVPVEKISEPVLKARLAQIMESFPATDFPEMEHRLAPFAQAMDALVRQKGEGLELAAELSEAFWTAFCHWLRIHPSAWENLSSITLAQWRDKAPEQLDKYDRAFDGILLDASELFPAFEKEPGLCTLVEGARGRMDEDWKYVEGFSDEFEGLGKFLDTLRAKAESSA